MPEAPARLVEALADRYRIEREIGAGGMATVYLAEDLKHHRKVAIKVLRPELGALLGAERFLAEIRTTASLQHPHILGLIDSGAIGLTTDDALTTHDSRLLFYVMPFVDGESLRDRLTRETQLPSDVAVRLAREVASALDYAHHHGVIHRDIKPENILLSGGHAQVADFGIARSVVHAGDRALTATGLVIGTPAYMSPEQAFAERELDGRSDQYALGAVLYEMLTGVTPLQGRSFQDLLRKLATEEPRLVTELQPDIPPTVAAATHRALKRNADERFPSLAAFGDALAAPAPVSAPEPPRDAEIPTIAIFDFTNLSGDPTSDWLGSGIAETLSTDLRKTGGIRVTGREDLARWLARRTGGDSDPQRLGREIGARWVVAGSYQVSGDRVRIIPRFEDCAANETVPLDKLDGSRADIFDLQDRLLRTLLDRLAIVAPVVASPRPRSTTRQLSAYEAFARGQQQLRTFTPTGFAEAEALFSQAVELDASYALAWAGLGSIKVFRYILRTDPAELEAGLPLLRRAIELDPDLAEPRLRLCYGLVRLGRKPESIEAGQRAVALEPDAPDAHYFLALACLADDQGDMRPGLPRALSELERAIEIEPQFAAALMMLGWLRSFTGDHASAAFLLDRAVATERGTGGSFYRFVGARALRAALHQRDGEHVLAEALASEELEALDRATHVYEPTFRAMAHCVLGDAALAREDSDTALDHFAAAEAITEQQPRRLAMGWMAIRALAGRARVFHSLGMRREAKASLAEAGRLFDDRERCNFDWAWDAVPAHACGDMASGWSGLDLDEARRWLARAIALGWADLPTVDHDPAWRRLTGDPTITKLRSEVA
jgi:serine/threonine protein kinase/tetratricopeptide (TPR) repeat protein